VSQFTSITYSLSTAESELISFKAWLAGRTFFGEAEVVAQIRARAQMCCLLASYAGIRAPDLIRFELTLKGLFRTDLVMGNDHFRQFALIEFEDAEANSLFSGGPRQYRHWSRRLEHGFGQVVDWAWIRNDHPNDTVLAAAFGGPIHDSAYLVVCGRDASLIDDVERKRFEYRRFKTRIEGAPVGFLTYDDMVKGMELSLENAKSFAILR